MKKVSVFVVNLNSSLKMHPKNKITSVFLVIVAVSSSFLFCCTVVLSLHFNFKCSQQNVIYPFSFPGVKNFSTFFPLYFCSYYNTIFQKMWHLFTPKYLYKNFNKTIFYARSRNKKRAKNNYCSVVQHSGT